MRKLFAEKILDLGNIAAGALVFGYLINRDIFPGRYLLVIGFMVFLGLYGFAYLIAKEEGQ